MYCCPCDMACPGVSSGGVWALHSCPGDMACSGASSGGVSTLHCCSGDMACPGASSGGVAGRSHGLGPGRQQTCRQQRAQQDEDRKNPSAGPRSVTAACISNDCGHLQLCQYSFLVFIRIPTGLSTSYCRERHLFMLSILQVWRCFCGIHLYSPSLEMLLRNSFLMTGSYSELCRLRHIPNAFSRAHE